MPKIRYIKNEFRFGITEYKTPCPFGMRDRYALQVYEVASRMCKDCPHFVKDDQFNSVLTCNYQEKEQQEKKRFRCCRSQKVCEGATGVWCESRIHP